MVWRSEARHALFVLVGLCMAVTLVYSRELCRKNGHVPGKWVFREEMNRTDSKKAFYCCAWENDEFLLNKEECGVEKWKDHYHYGTNEFYAQFGGHACSCDERNGRLNIRKSEKYRWEPDDCDLLEWDGKQFCKLLGKRKILLVGDSTMAQSAATLMSMVTADRGNCSNQIVYARNDYLTFTIKGQISAFTSAAGEKADICIINVGAHLHDMGDMWMIWSDIERGIAEFKKKKLHTKFIWKTASPGHLFCYNYTAPLVEYHKQTLRDMYAWYLQPDMDEMSKNYSALLGMPVLDLFPLYLRPEGHAYNYEQRVGPADCLHYCVPGPLNLFSILLLQMLHNGEV